MAIIIEKGRIVPTWCAAVQCLLAAPRVGLRNVLLEIVNPVELTVNDLNLLRRTDESLRLHSGGFTIETVSSTIFPNGLYKSRGRPDFYQAAIVQIGRGQGPHAWGTYALRLMSRRGPQGIFNPLEDVINKISDMKKRDKMWQSVLELGVHDPAIDLEGGCELPIYDPSVDRKKFRNMQCLSHLSLKISDRERLDLVAMYRHHYYAHRALGNLVGLAQLLHFISKETGMQVGSLTCLSTHAELDGGLGSHDEVRALVDGVYL